MEVLGVRGGFVPWLGAFQGWYVFCFGGKGYLALSCSIGGIRLVFDGGVKVVKVHLARTNVALSCVRGQAAWAVVSVVPEAASEDSAQASCAHQKYTLRRGARYLLVKYSSICYRESTSNPNT